MKEKKKKKFDSESLSAFCLQVSLLLGAAIPASEGFEIMAGDAVNAWERDLLKELAEETGKGAVLSEAMKKTDAFPLYVIRMASVGEQTGNLDTIMKELSVYYDKEAKQAEALRNAILYPSMLVVMLLVVLFVLFTKVMPVFKGVYEQLGSALSPVTEAAMNFGGAASRVALIIVLVLLLVFAVFRILTLRGIHFGFSDAVIGFFRKRSRISKAIAKRRLTSVLSMTIRSGLSLESGFSLAEGVIDNPEISEKIRKCEGLADTGEDYYTILKNAGLFSGFHIQMIKVGNRTGHMDTVMAEISDDFEEMADQSLGAFIAGFEPAVVAILAVCVGLVLLSVMLPLAGLLSSIG